MSTCLKETKITRRDALRAGLLGAAGLSLGSGPLPTFAAKPPSFGRAKAVIQIWMWGGPSHLDTFDPKPDAGYDYCGPYDKPIDSNVSGIQVGQMLPMLAQQADKYAIIRGMTHGVNAHETASYMVQTGHKTGERESFPSVGGVVAFKKGYDAGYKGLIPPYIVLTSPQGRFSEAGFLGLKYKPFATGGNPAQDPFAVEGIVAKGISEKRQRGRRKLLAKLDSFGKRIPDNPVAQQIDASRRQAYDLILGDAGKVFDLELETDDLRGRYGMNQFGQSCLAARRLVEQGVRYVTINYKGWDSHKQHFQTMGRKLPEMDRGLSALLEDLAGRGLLDSTIVWWGGEFGRGPKIQWNPPWNGGRSHHGAAFSHLVAGGGFKGGHVLGATDEKGMRVVERPVYPWDLIGSIYELLGIDPDGTLPHPEGRQVPLMPTADDGYKIGGRLREIMA